MEGEIELIYEIGHISIIIASFLSLLSTGVFAFHFFREYYFFSTLIKNFSKIGFFFVLISFLILEYAFINSEFSLDLVVNNSHTTKPLIYKISGLWGNHEGSILLWILILSFFTYLIAKSKSIKSSQFHITVLGIQNIILFLFCIFLLFTSNPFSRNIDPPLEGFGLNPLLQDPGLAFHPPMLYIGYVGLSVSFSFAIAILLNKKVEFDWFNYLKPWTLLTWAFLTSGIALGSWWAYYELGWGGWWFWDPVENASLMPWLISTALIHSITVTQKNNQFYNWTILLAIFGFSFSLLGTFIVRSGLLTSVHAFASDPTRGVFILIILALSTLIPLLIYGFKNTHRIDTKYFIFSKETGLLLNNIFLITSTITILIGTLYPLILETITGSKISVGAAYYNATFSPIMIPFIIIMAFAPFLGWTKTPKKSLLRNMLIIFTLAFISSFIIFKFNTTSIFGIICGYLSILLFFSVGFTFFKKLQNLKTLPLNYYGMLVAHLGLAIFLFGVTGEQFFKKESSSQIKINEVIAIGDYSVKLENVKNFKIDNYLSETGLFKITKAKNFVGKIKSEQRFYPVEKTKTTEAGIFNFMLSDIYITMGEGNLNEGWVVKAYFNPLVKCLWFGAFIMAIGGILSLFSNANRKYI